MAEFLGHRQTLRDQLLKQLTNIKEKFQESDFFSTHEVVGSSLLIVHDGETAGVWMIDFAKTVPLPKGLSIDHLSTWSLGNHEDGYLFGLNNLIDIVSSLEVRPEEAY